MPIVISRERLEKLNAYEALEEQCGLTQEEIIEIVLDLLNPAPPIYQDKPFSPYGHDEMHLGAGLLEEG